MKLAEALQIRADLQKRLAQIPVRLRNNSTMQEGTVPAEDPETILREMDSLSRQLEQITTDINLTNSSVKDAEGETMTALISRRDALRRRVEYMRNFLNAASEVTMRRQSTDIRILPTVNVTEFRKRLDRLSKELRELEMRIQSLNWTSELISTSGTAN